MRGKLTKKLCVILAGIMLVLSAAGCGSSALGDLLGSDTEEAAAETEAAEEEPEEEEEEEPVDEMELYNLYININNAMVGRFMDVQDSYFKRVKYQEEFELEDNDYWCLSVISTFYKDMDAAYELASKKSEKNALDNAYLALYPVMRELAETLDEVQLYTDMKSYLDDDYAKAKELHAVIYKDMEEYSELGSAFISELSEVANKQREEDMQMLKDEGLEGTYAVTKMIMTAQEIQSAIYEQGIDDSEIVNLDLEPLQPLYDQFVEEVETCLTCLADESAMAQEGFPVNSAFPDDDTIAGFSSKISALINDYNVMANY